MTLSTNTNGRSNTSMLERFANTVNEFTALFQKEADENGVDISNMRRNEAILKELVTYINIPFVLKTDRKQKHLVSETAMQKKNFTSLDTVFAVTKIVKK